jgi:epoxyqueuosine reductase
MDAAVLCRMAMESGFDLAGITPAAPLPEFAFYQDWANRGRAAGMGYLTDHRGEIRRDPCQLLPSAKSILVCGVLYNSREPSIAELDDPARAWISRYAWGEDYHDVLRARFEKLAARLPDCEYRICVDTAPLLERAYARRAGLGWIGKNSCLINEHRGSWFFLGEMLLSLELTANEPPPDRCGSCSRCIDACPTQAIIPTGRNSPAWELDAGLCISYHTIESKSAVPAGLRALFGSHVFGCDICQDVCPWNQRAPVSIDAPFQPREFAPPLAELAALSEEEFRSMFRASPIWRAKYRGFLRNVCTAMGNARRPQYRTPLEQLARHEDSAVSEHARWALERIES